VDVINLDKLCVNLFKVSILQGVKVSIFPIGNWRRRAACDLVRRCRFCFQGRLLNKI